MPKSKEGKEIQEQGLEFLVAREEEEIKEGVEIKEIKEEAEQTYPQKELVTNAQAIFGVMPEVLAGALYGYGAEEISITQAKKLIDEFLQRKVS